MIPSKALYPFCHAMSRMLEAGVDIRKALPTAVKTSSDRRLIKSVQRVQDRVKAGHDLTTSFRKFSLNYPPLFLDLLNVGEQTGALPEVMNALGDYYEARVRRFREFRSAIAWPGIQLFAAIIVIALLIYILGLIGTPAGNTPVDLLGLGLQGTTGAITWLGGTLGSLFGLWIFWKVLSRSMNGRQFLDTFLLHVPAVGSCQRKFAIARFAWCFSLTQGAGMSIRPSLTSSLNATANGAFIAAIPHIWNEIHSGETLGDALRSPNLFPEEFLHFVDTAEQSGTVPESMKRMSHHFDDEAHRALQWLTMLAARAVWGVVAMMIIYFIFKIAMFYINLLNSAASDVLTG
ncbi:MAG: type II secretion system F family protein [Fuerstiella sp.]|nr:type II secretion system F family protein [Fuerstiella sp.]